MKRHLIYTPLAMALWVLCGTAGLMAPAPAQAKASADEIARLGKQLTCMGAEKAGTASGVAEWTGKWLGPAPGMVTESGRHPVDPYAAEKPLFEINAQNYQKYAEQLSEGQKSLFRKYPATFRMNVYPAHRDFRFDEAACKAALQNAASAELRPDGMGVVNGYNGAAPFPFPKSGMELAWNILLPLRASWEMRDTDTVVVYPNGTTMKGWQVIWVYSPVSDPRLRGTRYEGVSSLTLGIALLPEREKGTVKRILDFYDYAANARQGWFYNPDTRRVRQLPGFGYDQPLESSGGTITVDDVRMFNGPPDRYQWKIVGKREVFIPYNGYRLEGKAAGEGNYGKLLTPGHENPDFVRWELHRVWVLEAMLKEGYRHLYGRRVFYIDEDTWLPAMADNFDARGGLWRFGWVNNYYLPGPNIFNAGSAFYHDLNSGAYSAFDLTQAKAKTYQINAPEVPYSRPEYYSVERMKSLGY
jgi:hypothetical protein